MKGGSLYKKQYFDRNAGKFRDYCYKEDQTVGEAGYNINDNGMFQFPAQFNPETQVSNHREEMKNPHLITENCYDSKKFSEGTKWIGEYKWDDVVY
jgi:hypothetical protein